MANISVSIPQDVKEIMNQSKLINWSKVVRIAILKKAHELAFLKSFASESELTEKDALELGKKVNKEVSKKYRGMM
ncbi:MAG: hypothetical protein KKG60_03770 [Nanoarchaeota archaeon]|nr:hypothetical protein [Nanoarchaeota archaeon]